MQPRKLLLTALASLGFVSAFAPSAQASTNWFFEVPSHNCHVGGAAAPPSGTWYKTAVTDANFAMASVETTYSPGYSDLLCPAPARFDYSDTAQSLSTSVNMWNTTSVAVDLNFVAGLPAKPSAMTCGIAFNNIYWGCGTWASPTGSQTYVYLDTSAELFGMISVGGDAYHYTYVRLTNKYGVGGSSLNGIEYTGSY